MQNGNLKRLISMLKCMKNPPFFMYRLFHYIKKNVSYDLAAKIAKRNTNDYVGSAIDEIIVDTYDGSCQVVHPDITYWNSNYWIALTPYPYGMEEYENPCVYVVNQLSKRIKCKSNPIAKPRKHDYGVHLSDPCIFHDGTFVKCVYRDTWKEKSTIQNALYISTYDKKWSTPQLVVTSSNDPLLSPAIIIDKKGNHHIFTALNNDSLVHRVFDMTLQKCEENLVRCGGLPEDYTVWHISIVYKCNLDKMWSGSEDLVGIFLLRNKSNNFKLFTAFADCLEDNWEIGEEIALPDYLINNAKIVYKSCFIPGSKKYLISFRDLKDRYRLCIV